VLHSLLLVETLQSGRSTVLDDVLVAALDGALALGQRHHVAERISDELDVGVLDELFLMNMRLSVTLLVASSFIKRYSTRT
jgi:hypothetical protein